MKTTVLFLTDLTLKMTEANEVIEGKVQTVVATAFDAVEAAIAFYGVDRGIQVIKSVRGARLGNKAVADKADDVIKGAVQTAYSSTDDAANIVAKNLDGTVTELKNGFKIEVANGKKPIVVRVMNEGSGGRANDYFRVSIDGKGSLTPDGILSSDKGLTHIDLTDGYLEQIVDMITKYQGK